MQWRGRGRRSRDARPDRRPRADRQGRGRAAGAGVGHRRAPRRRGRRPGPRRRTLLELDPRRRAPRSAARPCAAAHREPFGASRPGVRRGRRRRRDRDGGRAARCRRRRRCGSWRRSWASTSRRSTGTGPGGRVTAADVRAPRRDSQPVDEPARSRCAASGGRWPATWPTRGARSRTSRCSTRSTPARCSPRTPRVRAERGDGVTLTAFFVRAAVVALDGVPDPERRARRRPRRDRATTTRCTSGVAVASDDGLVVPVVHDAQTLTLRRRSATRSSRVTEAGRAGHLPPEAIRGATFTVTNFGTEGGRFATPIVRPPQVAILGFGAVRVRPVVDGDAVVAAPTLPVSLSADHRVVDGRDATGFLEARRSRTLRDTGDARLDAERPDRRKSRRSPAVVCAASTAEEPAWPSCTTPPRSTSKPSSRSRKRASSRSGPGSSSGSGSRHRRSRRR